VFLIRDGEVSVVLSLAHGAHQRIATLSSGMSFGEMVMLDQAARSANVHADTAVRCWTLSARTLDELSIARPEIKIAVSTNLSRELAQKLRQANQLIRCRNPDSICQPLPDPNWPQPAEIGGGLRELVVLRYRDCERVAGSVKPVNRRVLSAV
jgi:CRP-like cAMP-binding protein